MLRFKSKWDVVRFMKIKDISHPKKAAVCSTVPDEGKLVVCFRFITL